MVVFKLRYCVLAVFSFFCFSVFQASEAYVAGNVDGGNGSAGAPRPAGKNVPYLGTLSRQQTKNVLQLFAQINESIEAHGDSQMGLEQWVVEKEDFCALEWGDAMSPACRFDIPYFDASASSKIYSNLWDWFQGLQDEEREVLSQSYKGDRFISETEDSFCIGLHCFDFDKIASALTFNSLGALDGVTKLAQEVDTQRKLLKIKLRVCAPDGDFNPVVSIRSGQVEVDAEVLSAVERSTDSDGPDLFNRVSSYCDRVFVIEAGIPATVNGFGFEGDANAYVGFNPLDSDRSQSGSGGGVNISPYSCGSADDSDCTSGVIIFNPADSSSSKTETIEVSNGSALSSAASGCSVAKSETPKRFLGLLALLITSILLICSAKELQKKNS